MYIVFSVLKFGKSMTKLYLFFCFVLDDTPYKKEEYNNCKLIEETSWKAETLNMTNKCVLQKILYHA